MTIKEKDLKPNAQVRPEIVEFAQELINSNGVKDDEHLAYVSAGFVYRNQAFRECIVTGRITNQRYIDCIAKNKPYKDAYVTYVMPNGKVYKTALDSVKEYIDGTLKVMTFDIVDEVKYPD